MSPSIPVRNPRTGEVDFEINAVDADGVAAEAAWVRANQPAWAGDLDLRISTLSQWRSELDRRTHDIAEALTVDTGRRALSYAEVDVITGAIDRWCRLAPELLNPPARRASEIPGIELGWTTAPYAVAAVISPWNFPLAIMLGTATSALVAGNAVVLKPSSDTPINAAVFIDALLEPHRSYLGDVDRLAADGDEVQRTDTTPTTVTDLAVEFGLSIEDMLGSVTLGKTVCAVQDTEPSSINRSRFGVLAD